MCPTNNITVNRFQVDKLWSPFSKEFGQKFKLLSSYEYLWADQCLCENMDGRRLGTRDTAVDQRGSSWNSEMMASIAGIKKFPSSIHNKEHMNKGCLSGLPHARLQLPGCKLPTVTFPFDYLNMNINLVHPVKEQKELERWTDCYVIEFVSPPSPEATIPEMNADQPHHPRQWRHPMLPSIK